MWAQNPLVLFRQENKLEVEQSQIAAAGQQGEGERGGTSRAARPERVRQSVFMSD